MGYRERHNRRNLRSLSRRVVEFDIGTSRAKVWRSVVGARSMSTKLRENSNKEPMKSMNIGMGGDAVGAHVAKRRLEPVRGWEAGQGELFRQGKPWGTVGFLRLNGALVPSTRFNPLHPACLFSSAGTRVVN